MLERPAVGTMEAALKRAWALSDRLFEESLTPDALMAQPIDLRNPFLFYLGHLPAFAWNQARNQLDLPQFNAYYDDLFERGKDPDVEDPTKCHNHSEAPGEWPPVAKVRAYRDLVRKELQVGDRLKDLEKSQVLHMIVEHELMHVETLYYMVAQLDTASINDLGFKMSSTCHRIQARRVAVPAGRATLGAERDSFGWDNEFDVTKMEVEAFQIDALPITIGQFLDFKEDGGYSRAELWRPEDWAWREKHNVTFPMSWSSDGKGAFHLRGAHAPVRIESVMDIPVFVSLAEARAFAEWKNGRLPTEAEWHRAAFGRPDGTESKYPWGDATPVPGEHGNFGFASNHPVAVGSYSAASSAFGVQDLIGSGWEWCDSVFEPFQGFEARSAYPGYSADFFDGKHFVLKGGSWATDKVMIRRSFRNWYQAHYPYVFSKFRVVYPHGAEP